MKLGLIVHAPKKENIAQSHSSRTGIEAWWISSVHNSHRPIPPFPTYIEVDFDFLLKMVIEIPNEIFHGFEPLLSAVLVCLTESYLTSYKWTWWMKSMHDLLLSSCEWLMKKQIHPLWRISYILVLTLWRKRGDAELKIPEPSIHTEGIKPIRFSFRFPYNVPCFLNQQVSL